MKLPMFIEVEAYSVKELDDNKVQFSNKTEKTLIPVSWLGPLTEKTITLENGKQLKVNLLTVQYGRTYYLSDSYEDIKVKINNALPSGVKRESWQSDDNEGSTY
jgi:hypothetical protein